MFEYSNQNQIGLHWLTNERNALEALVAFSVAETRFGIEFAATYQRCPGSSAVAALKVNVHVLPACAAVVSVTRWTAVAAAEAKNSAAAAFAINVNIFCT